jgi:DNA-binding NtrC family response regulator
MLERRGFGSDSASSGADAARRLAGGPFDLALVDLQLPDIDGFELIRTLRKAQPELACIAMTGFGTPDAAARAAGACDFLEKPLDGPERLFQAVDRVVELQTLRRRMAQVARPDGSALFIGASPHAVQVRALVERFARVGAPVLVTGESGVGKEIVAEALHHLSGRSGSFVRINCAALPEPLIEAELFGAEEGTFTGQRGRRTGLFEAAHDGTIFLDEIGELPVALQPKLLRVLQSQSFRPLGSNTERPLTGRVIAATNRDLERSVARAAFREDLFFRLCVLRMHVLPLRDRPEDIPLLARHFLARHAASEGRVGLRLLPDAMAALVANPWPGNARELANVLLRAAILATSLDIGAADLELPGAPSRHGGTTAGWEDLLDRPMPLARAAANERFARRYLQALLARNGGNVSRAAREAGVLRPNLRREMKRYGVAVED